MAVAAAMRCKQLPDGGIHWLRVNPCARHRRNSVVINLFLSYAVRVINKYELITGLCCVVCFGLSHRKVSAASSYVV